MIPAGSSVRLAGSALELHPKRCDDAADGPDVLDQKAIRKLVHPRRLHVHSGVERPLSLVGQDNELRAPVMRVRLECDEPVLVQVVDDPLYVLPIGAEVARKPRDRLRPFGGDDRAEDLPAGAGQPEGRDQAVASWSRSGSSP